MPYDISGLIGAAYGMFPNGDFSRQRWVDAGQSPSGGVRTPQQFWGADAAGGIGGGYGPQRGDNMGGQGGVPRGMGTSQMPGYSYRSQGPASRYHEQIPMGGTRGVYAIRNDEINGPRSDALLDFMVNKSRSRGRGRAGGRRRRR